LIESVSMTNVPNPAKKPDLVKKQQYQYHSRSGPIEDTDGAGTICEMTGEMEMTGAEMMVGEMLGETMIGETIDEMVRIAATAGETIVEMLRVEAFSLRATMVGLGTAIEISGADLDGLGMVASTGLEKAASTGLEKAASIVHEMVASIENAALTDRVMAVSAIDETSAEIHRAEPLRIGLGIPQRQKVTIVEHRLDEDLAMPTIALERRDLEMRRDMTGCPHLMTWLAKEICRGEMTIKNLF